MLKFSVLQPKVFISYAREDQVLARYLHDRLDDYNFHSWYDAERIFVGDNFVKEITNNLHRTDGVIILISPDSVLMTFFSGTAVQDIEYGGTAWMTVMHDCELHSDYDCDYDGYRRELKATQILKNPVNWQAP